MLSQQLIGRLQEDWSQPTLVGLFLEWWYLILLSIAVAAALSWAVSQFVKAHAEMRLVAQAAANGNGGEEAAEIVAYYRGRRQTFLRPILLLLLILFLLSYPVAISWYGLE